MFKFTDKNDTPLYFSNVVKHDLEELLCLQIFDFEGTRADNGEIALDNGYCGQLNDLKLQDICCKTLDFKSATKLTSLSLVHIDGFNV